MCKRVCESKSVTWPSSGKTQIDKRILICSTAGGLLGWGRDTSIMFALQCEIQCKIESTKHKLSLQVADWQDSVKHNMGKTPNLQPQKSYLSADKQTASHSVILNWTATLNLFNDMPLTPDTSKQMRHEINQRSPIKSSCHPSMCLQWDSTVCENPTTSALCPNPRINMK